MVAAFCAQHQVCGGPGSARTGRGSVSGRRCVCEVLSTPTDMPSERDREALASLAPSLPAFRQRPRLPGPHFVFGERGIVAPK